ncbi:MAG: hypothetical protein E3J29_03645, partial [Dehalococcoidia bacterium]
MGFLSFFSSSPLGIAVGAILTVVAAAVIFAGVNVILAFSGGPGDCTPGGGTITVNDANAQAFQDKWDAFDIQLDGGAPSAVTLNESEVSSRANQYLRDETDVDFEDIRVCIHDGFGEATGSLEAFLGLDTKIKIKGNVDLTGENPEARDLEIEIGNVPGFITGAIEGLVEDAVDEALEDIDLKH